MADRTAYERETIMNYNACDKTASIYTWDKKLINKLMPLTGEREEVELVCGDAECATFIIPKSWIKIRPKRILSEEEHAALSERMKLARKANEN